MTKCEVEKKLFLILTM